MIIDSSLGFDLNVALTASRASTNVIDVLNAREFSGEEELYIICQVTTALAGPAGTTLNVQWQGSVDNSTWNTIAESGAQAAVAVAAGTRFLGIQIPTNEPFNREPGTAGFRYYRLNYVVGGGPLTAGVIFATITLDRQNNIRYPKNFTVTA